MHLGLAIYGDLNDSSGGFRYDRKLVEHCRAAGDTVEIISLPWRSYPRGLTDNLRQSVRAQLNQRFDVLLQDGLCHPSVWWHNRRLAEPTAVVGLLHHLQSDDPTESGRLLKQRVERSFLNSLDACIATSQFTRQRAATLAPSTASKPHLVAPPAGRIEGAAVSRSRVAARAEADPLRICFVGSLIPRKDPLTLCQAVAGTDWQLQLIGSQEANPAYVKQVQQSVDSLGCGDQIELRGHVETAALESTLAASHVCCLPSQYEAFGMSLLEAMEYGVVPIGSRVGGAGEFIEHTDNGFLVSPGEPQTIREILQTLAADRSRLAELGQAALATAAAHPTWAETLAEFRSFLSRVGAD